MTDPFDPTDRTPDAADEVASAYLDGAATPTEIERVESDGALADLVGDFSAVSGRVRKVAPPPAGTVDAAVSAALAEYDRVSGDSAGDGASGDDSAGDDGSGSSTTAPVVELAARRPWWSRVPLGAVAAAVVLVALVGVVGLASCGGDSADTATSALEDAGDVGGDAADAAESAATTDDAADEMGDALAADSPEAALDQAEDAGGARAERLRFSSPDTLADYLRDQLRPAPTSTGADADGSDDAEEPPAVDDTDPCDAVQVIGLDPSTVRTVVPVLLDEQLATAVVHGAEGDERLVVVDDGSCQVVVDREL